jgi:hypothetical protein
VPESVVGPPASLQSGIWAQTPVQPQALPCPPPPQVCGAAQLPQESVLPQPSPIWPQFAFWSAQVRGAHPSACPEPHWFGPPAPHDCPVGHVPHWTIPPHFGSVVGPQFAFSCAHVEGTQVSLASNKERLPPFPLLLPLLLPLLVEEAPPAAVDPPGPKPL